MADEPRNLVDEVEEESSPGRKNEREEKEPERSAPFFIPFSRGGNRSGAPRIGKRDARPYCTGQSPGFRGSGKDLAAALGIPGEYSLTADQRRAIELQRWNDRLNEKSGSLRSGKNDSPPSPRTWEKRLPSWKKARHSRLAAKMKLPENRQRKKSTWICS